MMKMMKMIQMMTKVMTSESKCSRGIQVISLRSKSFARYISCKTVDIHDKNIKLYYR